MRITACTKGVSRYLQNTALVSKIG